ncbi:hypothetical protein LTR96_006334 [Exophiala xenobiotica]|nr:hypothetical protein LTR92_009723 [Exophiala xenobiotica]KAK5220155.1 hypothetical protein LTR72_007686 [Exophiala xenobiotica]KAK5268627.1 hypothetical protein LTR96_006334 [Exophiala xenobiotica]KAK5292970.1 hypothetical protein LTR14_005319 [Exophiala xenobiotica]KAK5336821.1 hypothetical protein LTR98_007127 [Exophiala xenobiotica]
MLYEQPHHILQVFFSYDSGVLCYSDCNSLRILDFNHHRKLEKVFSGAVFTNHIVSASQHKVNIDLESLKSIQLHGYADDVVVLTCDLGLHGHHLFAVNISEDFNPPSRTTQTTRRRSRILLWTPLLSTTKLFVRHNAKYLVLGTHTAIGDDGHHEWLLQRFDLVTSKPLTREPLQLRKFYGAEIGSTVCFTIHEGMFYALTNQTSFESEEVDWTSYYHFISFPIDELNPDIKIRMIWRRQHLEGPINDAWADIGFQVDCRSGELLVVECRKEWVDGGSRSIRTYYSQPFERAEYVDIDDGTRMRAPPDDPLSRTLDEKSKSSYERAHVRIARYVHSEFQRDRDGDGDGEKGDANGNRNVKEYIRAKTKWNGYDFNKQCFVDLVSEEVRDEGSWKARERVRVRVVSRHEVSPLVVDEGAGASTNATAAAASGSMASVKKKEKERYMMVRPRVKNEKGIELRDGEEKYSSSSIFLWPRDTPGEDVDVDGQVLRDRGLDNILCPGGRAGEVKAVLGDEGIVYLAGQPAEASRGGERALVFVCFDPTFGFDGMRRVDGSMAVARTKEGEEDQQGEGDEAASHSHGQRKRKTEAEAEIEIGSGSGSGQLNTMRHQDLSGLVDHRTTWTPLKAESESESGSESCDVGSGLGPGRGFSLGLRGASLQHRHQHQHQTAGMWSNEVKVEPRAAEAQARTRTRTRTRLGAGSGSGSGSAAASEHLTPQNSYMSLDIVGLQAPQGQGTALYLGMSAPAPAPAPATMLEKTTMSWPPSPPLLLPPPLQSATAAMIPDARPSPPLPLPPSSQGAMLIPDAKPPPPPPPPRPQPGSETTERQQQQQLATLLSPDGGGGGDGDRDTSGASVQDGSGAQTKMEQKPNPKPKQLTYREKAPYISIGRGYWLR